MNTVKRPPRGMFQLTGEHVRAQFQLSQILKLAQLDGYITCPYATDITGGYRLWLWNDCYRVLKITAYGGRKQYRRSYGTTFRILHPWSTQYDSQPARHVRLRHNLIGKHCTDGANNT